MCLLWRQFEKVIYMEMGLAINENRDHNGEKHGLLISTLPLGPELPNLKEMQKKHQTRENN